MGLVGSAALLGTALFRGSNCQSLLAMLVERAILMFIARGVMLWWAANSPWAKKGFQYPKEILVAVNENTGSRGHFAIIRLFRLAKVCAPLCPPS